MHDARRSPWPAAAIAFNAWCAEKAVAIPQSSQALRFTENKRRSVLPAPFPLARSAGAPLTPRLRLHAYLAPPSKSLQAV